MAESEIKFDREGREGIVPVGSYLIDAAKRFGILFDGECIQVQGIHYCAVHVSSGEPDLSAITNAESEYFESNGRNTNERLACQAKIITPGEIVVMTNEKKEDAAPDHDSEKYRKEFAELPLEKKISELVQLEAIALGETFSFIANSPYLVFDKLMDVFAEFGLKKEQHDKESARPEEHNKSKKHETKSEFSQKPGTGKSAAKPKSVD